MKRIRMAAAFLTAIMLLEGVTPVYGAQADIQMAKLQEQELRLDEAPAEELAIEAGTELSSEAEEPDTEAKESGITPIIESEGEKNSEEESSEQQSSEEVSSEEVSSEETGSEEKGSEEESSYQIHVRSEKRELMPGETMQLFVQSNVAQGELTYESSDTSVAAVSADGVVTAVSGGAGGRASAVITVRYQDKASTTLEVAVYNTLTISETSLVLYAGGSGQLTAQAAPAGTVTWESSDTAVAGVNAEGKITAKKAGKATITARANGVYARCSLTVKKATLKLASKATIYLKNPQSLGAQALPAVKIKWSSSNKKIATVNSKGIVTGKKAGKVTITAKANGVTKKCRVTVAQPSVSFYSASAALFKDSSVQLSVRANPASKVKWKSSNSKVAKVDKNGIVTGRKKGKAKITAYVNGAKATCTVRVLKNPYSLSFEKRTLMIGDTANLYVKGLGSEADPSFHTNGSHGFVTIKSDGNGCTIKAQQRGTESIKVSFSTYVQGNLVSWGETAQIEVVDAGISRQQFSLAKGHTQQLSLVNVGAEALSSVAWTTSDPAVAAIDPVSGLLTAVAEGNVQVNATAVYQDGRTAVYTTQAKISDPQVASRQIAAAIQGKQKIQLKGTNAYSNIKWKSKKTSVVAVNADGTIIPRKKGTATVEITVDGQVLSCKVYVSNPRLSKDYAALAPGKNTQISVKGLSAKSTVKYESSNKKAATVSAKGKITAISCGKTEITVEVDGRSLSYFVEVAPQAAINAVEEGRSIMFSSTYSQALRMTNGYYDCSSLVFRSYGKNTALIGGIASWAPTAAGMAQHMRQTGKMLSNKSVDVSELLPGDLIFYGNSGNGRYLGIYHVSMYYGNGNRLEKPMYGYYPSDNIVMVARPIR